jgi:DNA modification methylase
MSKTIKITCQAAATLPLEKLRPLQGGLKNLSEENAGKLRASILRHGVTFPFFVWRDRKGACWIIDAHQRDKVLQALSDEGYRVPAVPVAWIQARNETEAREKILLCNSRYGEMSPESLRQFIGESMLAGQSLEQVVVLPDLDFGISANEETETEVAAPMIERMATLQKKWKVVRGHVWTAGPHRIMCGDSTSDRDVERLMDGNKAEMVFTDPPYGVEYESASGKFEAIKNDDLKRNPLAEFLARCLKLMVRHTTDWAAFYIWHASSTRQDFEYAIATAGLVERQYIIWAKPTFVLGRSDYQWAHEPCFYCNKDGRKPKFYGDRTQQTVWRFGVREPGLEFVSVGSGISVSDGTGAAVTIAQEKKSDKSLRHFRIQNGNAVLVGMDRTDASRWEIKRDTAAPMHPTQKPVELAARAIDNSSPPGGGILDLFSGSGSTLIACEQHGRIFYGMELEPKYVAVALERWSEMTGKTPKLISK